MCMFREMRVITFLPAATLLVPSEQTLGLNLILLFQNHEGRCEDIIFHRSIVKVIFCTGTGGNRQCMKQDPLLPVIYG